ncbi:hypothetical protein HP572_07465 [Pectobacterium sp. PL64]|uniref:hypothetical protein n=1 Tax=Pectobacterium sp. PL64 TaxID=2738983 RepID=UPI001F0C0F73|nr:hypothetical protein [Pectobacterium sp. PL64]UMO89352.1 hypothetical protein HP572_07465 [Pectobacterium sp. PL64]
MDLALPRESVAYKSNPSVKGESKIKGWLVKGIILVVAIVAGTIGKDIGKQVTKQDVKNFLYPDNSAPSIEQNYSNEKLWGAVKNEYEKEKIKYGLPKKIDEYTVLEDMYVEGHTIYYKYSVYGIGLTRDVEKGISEIARDNFRKNLCNTLPISKMRGKTSFTYSFLTGDVTLLYSNSDCITQG